MKSSIKQKEPIKKLKEEKSAIQFEIEEQSSESDEDFVTQVYEPIVKQKKIKAKQIVPVVPVKKEKKKAVPAPVIEESDTDYSSDSSEEIIVIKRGKKKPKAAKVAKTIKHEEQDDENDEQEYVAESQKTAPNFINYFC
jgi:hypothetical protein